MTRSSRLAETLHFTRPYSLKIGILAVLCFTLLLSCDSGDGVNPAPSVLRFVTSGGAADIHGLEAGIEYLATSWLSGFLNYTYQEINQTITNNVVRRGAPAHKINAGLGGE